MKASRNIFWLALFFFSAIGMQAKSAPADGCNLLLITLDTTRADRLGCYGFAAAQTPNLDALAKNGVRFANGYTPVPLTLPAHCSLFTGQTPLGHGVRNNASYMLAAAQATMAERLKQKGYHTYAVIASYVLLAKFGLAQGFDVFDDSLNLADMTNNFSSEIRAGTVYEKFKAWFLKSHQKKFFAWIHLYDPHLPYDPPAPYAQRFVRDPYSGEIAYMDSVIGRILADLKEKNILHRTLVVVAGDHGEDLGEHREYGHGIFCYEQSLRVPLIVSAPSLLAPRVVSERVNLIDVLPTLCDLLGLSKKPETQGESFLNLLKGGAEKRERDLYFESLYSQDEMGWAPLTGILSGPFKYIHLPEAELYDLSRDPAETDNLFFKKNIQARNLNRKLQALMLRLAGKGGSDRRTLSAADRRHLASLGYLSSLGRTEKAVDPKRGNAVKDQLRSVKQLIADKNLDQAENDLQRLKTDHPDIKTPIYYDLFEEIYKLKKDLKSLIAIQKKAAEEFPANSQIKFNLANNLFNTQHLADAEQWLQKIVISDPTYTRAYILLGNIRFNQKRLTEALTFFEKAQTLEPQNLSLKKHIAIIVAAKGDVARALSLLDELVGDERLLNDAGGRDVLVEIALKYAEYNAADRGIALLRRLLQFGNIQAKIWNELGSVYFRKKDFLQARECYEKALAVDPAMAISYSNLGALQLTLALQRQELEGLRAAQGYFDQAIARDATLAPAYNGRAAVHRFLKRIPDALADWKKALELNPEMSDPYFNLGITYLERGDKAEALKYFRRCQQKLAATLSPAEKKRLLRLIAEAERG